MKIFILSSGDVVEFNRNICIEGHNNHQCNDPGKIESALHSALYPGIYPFAHGGVARVAGAIAFYICQAHAFFDGNKRTAAVAAITFMNLNGLDVEYPCDDDRDDLSELIILCASGKATIDDMKEWFDTHKIAYQAGP